VLPRAFRNGFERVDAEAVGQGIVELFLGDAICGTPKPRKAPAGTRLVWMARVMAHSLERRTAQTHGPGARAATVGPQEE